MGEREESGPKSLRSEAMWNAIETIRYRADGTLTFKRNKDSITAIVPDCC